MKYNIMPSGDKFQAPKCILHTIRKLSQNLCFMEAKISDRNCYRNGTRCPYLKQGPIFVFLQSDQGLIPDRLSTLPVKCISRQGLEKNYICLDIVNVL